MHRRLTATLSGRATEVVREGGLAGTDWETGAMGMTVRQRACVIPQYRDIQTKAFDQVLAARVAIYAHGTQLPLAENISRHYFSGYLEFEEIPA